MVKIYVAGKNVNRAQGMMNALVQNGHMVTFDWTKDIENETNLLQKAEQERRAVQEADVLVYLWEADQESARYEAGMAMGLNKRIIVSGFPKKEPFFLNLPEVVMASKDEEIASILKGI